MNPNIVDVLGTVYSGQSIILYIDSYEIRDNASVLYRRVKEVCPDAEVDGIRGIGRDTICIDVGYYPLDEDDILELAGYDDYYFEKKSWPDHLMT